MLILVFWQTLFFFLNISFMTMHQTVLWWFFHKVSLCGMFSWGFGTDFSSKLSILINIRLVFQNVSFRIIVSFPIAIFRKVSPSDLTSICAAEISSILMSVSLVFQNASFRIWVSSHFVVFRYVSSPFLCSEGWGP